MTVELTLGDDEIARIADAVVARLSRASVQADSPELLTLREAASALRCSERKVRRLVGSGRLHASRLDSGGSSRVLIARSEIARLLSEGCT